jgi:hypothetical protein
MFTNFFQRTTFDIVILCLTFLVCAVLLVLVTGAVIGKIVHPELPMENITTVVELMVSNITGALLGFVGGKAAGKLEAANGENH